MRGFLSPGSDYLMYGFYTSSTELWEGLWGLSKGFGFGFTAVWFRVLVSGVYEAFETQASR